MGAAQFALLLSLALVVPALAQAPSPDSTPGAPGPEAYAACFNDLAALAATRGIDRGLIGAQFDKLQPDPAVLAAANRQAEFVRPIWEYIEATVTDARIGAGQAKLAEWAPSLDAIERSYGVDRHVLVAIWGVESTYGAVLDDTAIVKPVIRSLATLACGDTNRAAYWRDELMAAIAILAKGDITPERMTGSWAGAMSHTQFMPMTYRDHAVDFDGDGRRDIWGSIPDALASTASYLRNVGWRAGEGWGFEVLLPSGFDYRLADESTERPLSEWLELGLRTGDGRTLADTQVRAALALPAGADGPAFLLQPNFRMILRYNTALSYALTVAHLSDRLRGLGGIARDWPRQKRPLTPDEIRDLQGKLTERGFDAGGIDGKMGPKTRAAIRSFQASADLTPDGFADAALLARLVAKP
ncbi:lytic murein transglycosylase [Methylobacterium durans]|uniref:lytic murein transglycosylase n=1 Tax=Methylobacterium durans TaxID=2202825 RepID=UPI002AFF332C|nr:lytic murein transglycosylase [Methylobacterium durans]MEA1830931.1 lytic murein transglycosylase [Methylobacterium durans]